MEEYTTTCENSSDGSMGENYRPFFNVETEWTKILSDQFLNRQPAAQFSTRV